MPNTSNDLQAVGSNTRPHMLDRTDYESWAQQIRMYCRGKENGVNILQSIDNGPYHMGTTRDTLWTANNEGVTLGIDRPRTYNDLDQNEKKRFDADIRATNIEKMLLMQAQENGAVFDEEELLFLTGEQANTYGADVDDQPVQDMAQSDPNLFQADD
nr:integrase, catalytic region, zinc finger, CCHC-type, peptidase aspartic, catalytic [Tanacetum cinerariifolium]GEZ72520.1 integrase, catalytic region, zinc finger, CCHC-type, peptidase aspartic, catalytic [Tanacetum cinerariifolium]